MIPDDKKTKAHFFWHGSKLSPLMKASLVSFSKNGFEVNLWTYNINEVPFGVNLKDANEIMPLDFLDKCTQGGRKRSITCFSNFFRYKLLSEQDGWWFDTDIICLKNCHHFDTLEGNIAGYESHDYINGAILRLKKCDSKMLLAEALDILEKNNNNIIWGAVGARLITDAYKSGRLSLNVQNREIFYPLVFEEAVKALAPSQFNYCADKSKKSLAFHYWNDAFKRFDYPTQEIPARGSYIYELSFLDYFTCPNDIHTSEYRAEYRYAVQACSSVPGLVLLEIVLRRIINKFIPLKKIIS